MSYPWSFYYHLFHNKVLLLNNNVTTNLPSWVLRIHIGWNLMDDLEELVSYYDTTDMQIYLYVKHRLKRETQCWWLVIDSNIVHVRKASLEIGIVAVLVYCSSRGFYDLSSLSKRRYDRSLRLDNYSSLREILSFRPPSSAYHSLKRCHYFSPPYNLSSKIKHESNQHQQ